VRVLKKHIRYCVGKRSYAGGPRVLREKRKSLSIKAGEEMATLVSVKQGTISKAAVDWLVA